MLKSLDTNKGAGPESIPPNFIKKGHKYLTLPLKIILNKSLETSTLPDAWKAANVFPIFKKGAKNNVRDYRPISMLNVISKVFEKLWCPILSHYSNNMLSVRQYGFCRNRSTVSHLLGYVSDLCKNVDNRQQVDSTYTDFSSAFDKIDHSILILKLGRSGSTSPYSSGLDHIFYLKLLD